MRSTAFVSNILAPNRKEGIAKGARLMFSMPPATTHSSAPGMMARVEPVLLQPMMALPPAHSIGPVPFAALTGSNLPVSSLVSVSRKKSAP